MAKRIISKTEYIQEGIYTLTMIVDQPGFNINWLDFDYLGGSMHQEDNIVTNFSAKQK